MNLGVFALDEPALRSMLANRHELLPGGPGWDHQSLGAEDTVRELLGAAQRHHFVTAPTGPFRAELDLVSVEDPDGGSYLITTDLHDPSDGSALRLAGFRCDWHTIAPENETGIDAALTILRHAVTVGNGLLQDLERATAPAEEAAYGRAVDDSLDVTDGIEAIEVCGCGEPIALWEGDWYHVFNEQLRGTDDHDPAPN